MNSIWQIPCRRFSNDAFVTVVRPPCMQMSHWRGASRKRRTGSVAPAWQAGPARTSVMVALREPVESPAGLDPAPGLAKLRAQVAR